MIVKDEEVMLAGCLDSLKDCMDEMIIVDTGSTDNTKRIARAYTDKVYEFAWTGSFADARNFSFSLATGDYIYCADADELLDKTNRRRLQELKRQLESAPEIEIIQMYYVNQLSYGSVYNFDKEYRPKIYKRLRSFRWTNPIHECVVMEPLVFDSDIEIRHRQQGSHAERDLLAFERVLGEGLKESLPPRLVKMYAMELYKAGNKEHLEKAVDFFLQVLESVDAGDDAFQYSGLIPAIAARADGDTVAFFKYAMRLVTVEPCSEICLELGRFYEERGDWQEAHLWYYNAAFETKPVLDLEAGTSAPLEALSKMAEKLGHSEKAQEYQRIAQEGK